MKKEYNKPVIEIRDIKLSSLIAASPVLPGEGNVDPEGDPIGEYDVAIKDALYW